MPTLQPIPGTRGYLLAYEKVLAHGRAIRLVYYRSRAALIAGRPSLQTDLPRRFSPYSNGTPTILSVAWHGSPVRSVIQLGFHYELQVNGRPGPDREAIGIVSGFYQWRTSKDQSADQALSAQGLPGSHGGWRQFTYNDYQWRVYEAQRQFNSFATWHLILYNPVSHAAYPLSLHLGDSRMTSAGNPTVSVQAAPGRRAALVVTAFVFRAPSRTLTRELIYYQPISS
jgi:hypothetical protein